MLLSILRKKQTTFSKRLKAFIFLISFLSLSNVFKKVVTGFVSYKHSGTMVIEIQEFIASGMIIMCCVKNTF